MGELAERQLHRRVVIRRERAVERRQRGQVARERHVVDCHEPLAVVREHEGEAELEVEHERRHGVVHEARENVKGKRAAPRPHLHLHVQLAHLVRAHVLEVGENGVEHQALERHRDVGAGLGREGERGPKRALGEEGAEAGAGLALKTAPVDAEREGHLGLVGWG